MSLAGATPERPPPQAISRKTGRLVFRDVATSSIARTVSGWSTSRLRFPISVWRSAALAIF